MAMSHPDPFCKRVQGGSSAFDGGLIYESWPASVHAAVDIDAKTIGIHKGMIDFGWRSSRYRVDRSVAMDQAVSLKDTEECSGPLGPAGPSSIKSMAVREVLEQPPPWVLSVGADHLMDPGVDVSNRSSIREVRVRVTVSEKRPSYYDQDRQSFKPSDPSWR